MKPEENIDVITRLHEKIEWLEAEMIKAHNEAEEERDRVLAALDEEPDLPEDMIDELLKQVKNCDRFVVEKLMRTAIRAAWDDIYKRIEGVYAQRPI